MLSTCMNHCRPTEPPYVLYYLRIFPFLSLVYLTLFLLYTK